MFVTGGNFVAASGSGFIGDGSGLTNITIANLAFETSIMKSGSFTASISPDNGFVVNTSASIWGNLYVGNSITAYDVTASHRIFAPTITGSMLGTYTFQGEGPTASAEYNVLRYDTNRNYYVPQPDTSLSEVVSFANQTDLYVTHSLGVRYPHVQIYETGSAGTEAQILPLDIISINENVTRVRFSGPTTGKAVIGKAGSILSGTINGDRVLGTVLSASFAINAGTAESIQGFDSASLAALSASLAGGSQYVLNSQTSSMRVFSASFASVAQYALNAQSIDTSSFVQTSQTASMSVLFGGRLGEYKYYDMHQVIESALNFIKKEINGH